MNHTPDDPTIESAGRSPAKPAGRRPQRLDSTIDNARPVRGAEGVHTVPHTQPLRAGSGPTIGRYEVGPEIGRGGMGVIVEAHDPALRRTVAVKRLQGGRQPHHAQLFVDEAQITAQLEHPNIVPVHDTGVDADGLPWLAMKRIRGRSLSDVITGQARRTHPITPEELGSILDVITRTAEALAFAHDQGVIHRDLKPANVMVGSHGEVLLMDWGLARPIGAAPTGDRKGGGDAPRDVVVTTDRREQTPELTADGRVAGTPAYMAPEQAAGNTAAIGIPTDVFGIAAILYHQLTLRPPYQGDNSMSVLAAARSRQLVPPRKRAPGRRIPAELDAIVMKAMAARPADRYRNVGAFLDDIHAFRGNLPVSAAPPSLWRQVVKWTRRRPVAAIAVGLVTAFALVLGLVVTVLQATAADAQRLADLETARAEADAADARAREQQLADEKFRAELAAKARQGEIHELQGLLGIEATRSRDAVLEEWQALARDVMPRGDGQQMMFAQLTPEQAERYLRAYERLFEAHRVHGVPITANDHLMRAVLYGCSATDFTKAINEVDVALEMDPTFTDAWLTRALFIMMDARPTEQALECVNRAIACAEADGDRVRQSSAHVSRASVRQMLRDPAGAMADVQQARELDPRNGQAMGMQAGMEMMNGNYQYAIQLYDQAVASEPRSMNALTQRAMFYANLGARTGNATYYRQAMEDCDRAIHNGPRFSVALTIRGIVRQLLGNEDEALRDFRHAAAINRGDVMAWMQIAILFATRGRHEEAAEAIRNAESVCPPFMRPQLDGARRTVEKERNR